MMSHVFGMEHMEAVYRWAAEVGPEIPAAVEFQMLMSQKTLMYFRPGIEAAAPIFADSEDELREATAFMRNSPVKKLAYLRTPFVRMPIKWMYSFAMTHYPSGHFWGVDNMWTAAPVDDLIPFLKKIAATLPPPPAHVLWLNWHPPAARPDMAFSTEDKIYIALYGAWKSAADYGKLGTWAADWMRQMEPMSSGIQLADEGLHRRPARFVSDAHLRRLDEVRSRRDPSGLFYEWHSRPAGF